MRDKPCSCSPEHTVAKLGHCRSCHWSWANNSQNVALTQPSLLSRFGCPPRHVDGTQHNFSWATYSDTWLSTGVCRCGLQQIDVDLMVAQ